LRAEASWLTAVTVLLPFAASAIIVVTGGTERSRRILAFCYAVLAAGFNLALLNAFLNRSHHTSWGSITFTPFGFPAFLVLNMLTVAAVLYAGFKPLSVPRPALLMATIPAACGLGGMALVATTLLSFVLMWLGVSAVAFVGLLAHDSVGLRPRFRAFVPWLLADALLASGALLCSIWLKESAVLIEPPLTSGNEAQVVTVMALFLASAFIRLAVFPVHAWSGDLVSRTDSSWSSFYLGGINFLLAGMRLAIVIALVGRLVSSDWSAAIAICALLSVVVGPIVAIRAGAAPGCVSGFYCAQSGALLLSFALFSRGGFEAGLFLLLVAPLFLTAFLMAFQTTGELRGTGRLGRQPLSVNAAPLVFGATLFSGMAIAGVPPMDGFVGKAMLALASSDKAGVRGFYALALFGVLVGLALGLVAVVRVLGGAYAARGLAVSSRKPHLLEGLVPLGICAASLMIGLFPGILSRNFIGGGSRLLFPRGFVGPGVVFRGTSDVVASALSAYRVWGDVAGAFLLVLAVVTLIAYFASRAAHPPSGAAKQMTPFLGGADGAYEFSWPDFPLKRGRGFESSVAWIKTRIGYLRSRR